MKSEYCPMVSVQCLAYNHEKYIRECLEGLVNQKTDFKYEVIVHDDASTDNTVSIIKEYAEKYSEIIKPIFEKENLYKRDQARMRQIITEKLTGKYIAFCECDDYWIACDKLQKQVDFLETHPDYSMCFHSAKKQYETNTISWLKCEDVEDRDYSPTEVFVNWIVPTASILCRREAIENRMKMIGSNRILNGDITIVLSSAMIGKIRGMHEQMSVYRVQSSGITYDLNARRKRAMRAPHHFECLRDNFPIVDRRPLDDTISKTYFERALVQDSFRDRLRDFYQSLRNDPRRFFSMVMHTIWNSLKS
jgi:glycosyltransferase involved in cell wall biosynthesis